MKAEEILKHLDWQHLDVDCSVDEVKEAAEQSLELGIAGLCVTPYHVKHVRNILEEQAVSIISVISYPLGYSCTPAKVDEAKRAIDDGVEILEMSLNTSAVINNDWAYVLNDIQSVATYVHFQNCKLRLRLPMDLLKSPDLKKIAKICNDVGVNGVIACRQDNGFPSKEDIELLNECFSGEIELKVVGDIKTISDIEDVISWGVQVVASDLVPENISKLS